MQYKFSELIDQLIGAHIRLTIFDHLKKIETDKDNPNHLKITEWEKGARWANERRAEMRNAIDEMLSHLIKNGYIYEPEPRTFGAIDEKLVAQVKKGQQEIKISNPDSGHPDENV